MATTVPRGDTPEISAGGALKVLKAQARLF
jgi:hypothetical protein